MRIDRIKFATELAKRDLTILRLSELSGVSRNTLTAVKTGKSCAPATVAKIADGLGVDIREIIAD